jgi:4-hydroxy-3-methylbut-2-enyl diphosphate reductase
MKFSSAAVSAIFLLVGPYSSDAFSPTVQGRHHVSTTELCSSIEKVRRKKEDRLGFMKNPQYHRKGFLDVRPKVADTMGEHYTADLVENLKSNNYMVERDGVTTSLAKDFGFCWGVERSITLAYEAVEHYPNKKLHITNELIHNPEVNDALQEMKINLIHKELNTGTKDFSTVGEGDVVILPAFGASYEEMEMLDKKVRKKKSCEGMRDRVDETYFSHRPYCLAHSELQQLFLNVCARA